MFNEVLNFFTSALENVGATLLNLFTSIANIFYSSGSFTFVGVIFLISLGTAILIWAIDWLVSLIGLGGDD